MKVLPQSFLHVIAPPLTIVMMIEVSDVNVFTVIMVYAINVTTSLAV